MNTDRFDEMEAAVFRGKPWMFRDPSAPNPLTIEASGWSTGHTTLGEAEFLQGVDRDGQKWSVLVGSVILNKRLIEGVVEAWDPEKGGFAVVRVEGRVQPGEIVSLFYKGDKQGAQYSYPNFDVARKPLTDDEAAARAAYEEAPNGPFGQSDEVPY